MLTAEQSPVSAAERQLPTELTSVEWRALAVAVAPGSRRARLAAREVLSDVLDPLVVAGDALRLDAHSIGWVQRAVLRGMHDRHTACGSWSAEDWIAVAQTARTFRGNVIAVACWLGRLPTEQIRSARIRPTDLARRLFGRWRFEREVERVRAHLRGVGYGPSAMTRRSLSTALAVLFVRAGRAELEALTIDLLQDAHQTAPARSEHRRMCYRVAHAVARDGPHSAPNSAAVVHLRSCGRDRSGVGGMVHSLARDDDPRTGIGEVRVLRHPQGRSLACT
jgi:hypothetical protein